MIYYLVDKTGGQKKQFRSLEAAENEMKTLVSKNPDLQVEILDINQYRDQYEIPRAREAALRADNPIMSAILPEQTRKMAETGSTGIKGGLSGAFSLLGRGAGAVSDVIFNRREGADKSDAFLSSLGRTYKDTGLDPELFDERSGVGDFVQMVLRDPLTTAGIAAVPVSGGLSGLAVASRIPTVAKAGQAALKAGSVIAGKGRPLAQNFRKAAAASAATETARPVAFEDEVLPLSDIGKNLGIGVAIGTGLPYAGKALRTGYGALSRLIPKRVRSYASDIAENMAAARQMQRTGMAADDGSPESLLANIERKYGVSLDEWTPEMASAADRMNGGLAEAFQIAAGKRTPPIEQMAEWLASQNALSKSALMEASHPAGLAALRANYRTPLALADEVIEKLKVGNLVGDESAEWSNWLRNASESGTKIDAAPLVEILDAMENAAALRNLGVTDQERSVLNKLSGYSKALKEKRIKETEPSIFLDENGRPIQHGAPEIEEVAKQLTPEELNTFRRVLGDIDWNKVDAKDLPRSQKQAIEDAYGKARDLLIEAAENGGEEGASAAKSYREMARLLQIRDDLNKNLSAGNDKSTMRKRIATTLKNRANGESNSPSAEVLMESLQNASDVLGDDFTKRAQYAYWANQLSPSGDVFTLPAYSPRPTGKSYADSPVDAARKGATVASAVEKVAERKAQQIKLSKKQAKAAEAALNRFGVTGDPSGPGRYSPVWGAILGANASAQNGGRQ
jgi:hypothetical protein